MISIHDRGFLYGDGLFESIRVYEGRPFLWCEHMGRFEDGASALGLVPPLSSGEMRAVITRLLQFNRQKDAVARITLSRGIGRRGYSPCGADHPTLVIALYPTPASLPDSYRVIISEHRLSRRDTLARFKHCSKLVQVVARAEADAAKADEALLLDDAGHIVEGTSSNLFWIAGRKLCTAPASHGLLEGTTRRHVIQLAREIGLEISEQSITPGELPRADGVFLTSTAIEVMPVSRVDVTPLRIGKLVTQIKNRYRASIRR